MNGAFPTHIAHFGRWLVMGWLGILTAVHAASVTTEDFDLSATEARLVYLDFWASWCAPCAASFPWMQDIAKRFAGQGLQVVAVNVDRDRAAAERFIDRHQPRFQVVFDPNGKIAKAYGIRTMPSSFLVRPDGTRLLAHTGFRLSDRAELERSIAEALARADDSPAAPGAGHE
ncbi:TlpA disulfide reductase family protein [Algiphilus sp.]|uniref:TlpA disulfide reductase family protein n=1 Tax=Algiphilus sp. TaxID=1872431 RepID=UPI003B529547